MTTPSTSRFQLRSDLELSWQTHQGAAVVVVKDPLQRRYFRFKGAQATIVGLMSEPVDAETMAAAVSEQLGGTVSAEAINNFFALLEERFLVDTPRVRHELALEDGRKAPRRNLLYWRLATLNPERIFAWLAPRTRFAFRPAFHVFGGLTILAGFAIFFTNWNQLSAGAPQLLGAYGLLLVFPVIFTVITIHEFAHGITCRHFGGKVHEVGFMLIYFQPAFFCDVSDSWLFPLKRHRLWVTFAGGYAQFIVWGLCAVVWRITDTDTLINQAALTVVLFSGLQSLVNFNPLIKLDGYYMLSDYLEIPNLRAKASRTVWDWVSGKPSRRDLGFRAQFIYGVAALVFSTALLVYVYSALYVWSTSRYQLAGLIGFGTFFTYTVRRTASDLLAGIRALATRLSGRRLRYLFIAGALALLSLVVPWELKIPAEFRVLPRDEQAIRMDTDGIIDEILVQEGREVQKGEVLARMRDVDFDKRDKRAEITGMLLERRSQLALLLAGSRPEEIERKRRLVETKQVEVVNARRTFEQLNQLDETLARKKAELALAEQEAARAVKLFGAGLLSLAEKERAESAVEVRRRAVAETEGAIRVIKEASEREADAKEKELAEAESELQLTMAGPRLEQIEQQRAEIAKLESQVALLNRRLASTDILAPIDGIVSTQLIERKLKRSLAAGEEFGAIVDTRHVTIEMQVPEKELADVRLGNTVRMKVRSFPGEGFEGHIDFIAPVAQTTDNNRRMIIVRSEVSNDSRMLKPEMTGVAKIYCGKRRIAEIATRRVWSWIRTEFWDLLP